MINRKLTLAARPEGLIKNTDFNLEKVDLPPIKEGEFLIKTLFLSLAPVMKFYMLDGAGIESPLRFGDTMRGRGVGEIIESNHPKFKVGEIVQGKMGWQEYVISKGEAYDMMYHVPNLGLSPSTALGVLGMTGCTSYFGLFNVGELKEGDNVLVSAAAGGVGSIIGGLCKIKGARALGLTSKEEKKSMLVNELDYYAAINYKTENISEQISKIFPSGIDIYFDNVGGEILDTALLHLKKYARVVCCGRISTYKDQLKKQEYKLSNWHMIGAQRAKMQGFFIYDFEENFAKAKKEMSTWIREDKLHYKEDILHGLEKMPEALNRLFLGKNMGKQIVKIS